MTYDQKRTDELDRLLAGRPDERILSSFLARARQSLTTPPDEATATQHLAATVAEAQEHAHTTTVTAPPNGTARWRRRIAHVFGYTATKVALGVGIAVAATGGLAATESLPDPAQRVVSTGASYLGVDFPYPVDTLEATPVEELPDPDTGIPGDEPADDRSESTRGADVDAPDSDQPPGDAPTGEGSGVDDAPPVDPPSEDDDSSAVPPAGEDDRPEPPVDPDDPPSGEDDTPPADGDAAGSPTGGRSYGP